MPAPMTWVPATIWFQHPAADAHSRQFCSYQVKRRPPRVQVLPGVDQRAGGGLRLDRRGHRQPWWIGTLALLPGSCTSAPVNITILASTTNPNPTDAVNIVATDPIAIAGTNACVWFGMTNATPAWTNWPPANWQSFTNWGPKNALFTVCRFGDASRAMTVNYHIGGTASNGVDYATLPGSVTLPAGGVYALIPIVPIDTSSFPKTVVLTLTPSTNAPPDYGVSVPPRAAALILHAWPRPLPFLLPDGRFHFYYPGPDGAWFGIQTLTDMTNWSCVSTNQVFQGSIDFVDPDSATNSVRLYRVAPQAGPPSQ